MAALPALAGTKSWSYDNPNYLLRQSLQFGKVSGNAATAKLIAYANMQAFAVSIFVDVAGTSTFSSTISAQTFQLTVITNTNTTGTAITLTTTTWGPYAVGGLAISTATGTGLAGAFLQFSLNTSTGTASLGGYFIPQGSEMVVTLGADATAVLVPSIDYQLAVECTVPA
jgi:hypothetical protein